MSEIGACPDFPRGTVLRHHVDGSHTVVPATDPWDWSDHYPSGGEGMDGYGYVSCNCGWDSADKLGWVEHIEAMLPPDTTAALAEVESAARQSLASVPVIRAEGRARLAHALDALDELRTPEGEA